MATVLLSGGQAALAQTSLEESTCKFLAVVGGNQAAGVDALMRDIADRWTDEARDSARSNLAQLAAANAFAGGNAYRIAKIGDDLEEHLVLLRLQNGELTGARLRYEWTPDGIALVSLDVKRRYDQWAAVQFLQTPELLDCE